MDKPDFLANFLLEDSRDHFCSVQKAVIPIARCPDCAKCFNCKKSQRSNALQEALEQVIIEQMLKICEEPKTVIAKYPFLKDPIDFLSARHNGSNNKDQTVKVYKGQCR